MNSEKWIISHILEPATHWTQRNFGFTCFTWANLLMTIATILYWLSACKISTKPLTSINIASMVLIFGFLWWSVYRLTSTRKGLRTIEKQAKRSIAQGCMNPYINSVRFSYGISIAECAYRFGGFTFNDVRGPWLMFTIPTWTYWLALGCAACTPLPPGPSKLRKAFDKMVSHLKSLSGAGEPVHQPI